MIFGLSVFIKKSVHHGKCAIVNSYIENIEGIDVFTNDFV